MKWTSIFLLLALALPAIGQETSLDQGATLMKDNKWNSAIRFYQEFIDKGEASGELHYNMGVAYAELGDVGNAIWHFELAKKWGLDTDAVHHNLKLVREERADEIEVIPEFFLKKWWDSWRSMMNANGWAILSMISMLAGIYGLYYWRTGIERTLRKRGFIAGLILCVFGVLCFISAKSAATSYEKPSTGVLLSNTINLRSAPDEESAPILEIHGGADIDVQDQIGDWIKVRLANGQEGWLPETAVGLF